MNQYRPYLSIQDAFKLFKFIIENNFFDNEIFNVVSNNFTVKQILKKIKKYKKNIRIKMVKSKIMNHLSYYVSNKKLSKAGLILRNNLDKDIRNTLKLLRNI